MQATPYLNNSMANADVCDWVSMTGKAMGDPLRARVLQALAHESFGVQELCEIFQVAQPALSHHLRVLADAGLVSKRKEGTSVFYQRAMETQSELYAATYATLDQQPIDKTIALRMDRIYAERAARSTDFFTNNAEALNQQSELVGSTNTYASAVEALIGGASGRQTALEVGPGTGELLKLMAPHFEHVIGIDHSADMLAMIDPDAVSAKHVAVKQTEFIEFRQQTFDFIVAGMVLHHQPSPQRFISHAASLLNQSGLLVIADLAEHNNDWTKTHCGDLWLGFSQQQFTNWFEQAGLDLLSHQYFAQRNGFTVQVLAARALA